MSESTPNSSRTFAILSGEAISVSARLSGCTLERSVIAEALGEGRARLNVHATFGGSGKSVMKRFASSMSPSTRIVSKGAPPWMTAATSRRRAGEGHVAIARPRARSTSSRPSSNRGDIARFAEAEADARIEALAPARERAASGAT